MKEIEALRQQELEKESLGNACKLKKKSFRIMIEKEVEIDLSILITN